ncbi:hypothetical protein ED208_12610 [Stagnimonas aquatica]|uniref:Uncharacterized protein n=1 Tax=Stagnimonas aquatica TaxID=2689987 RepID=A0A3N0V7V1_9GAMM|nr:hypothetical protein ED208_12610 [Stagnimonas aquatica]
MWVFDEAKLDQALLTWSDELGALLPEESRQITEAIRRFLTSEAALKLRVRECEPPPSSDDESH